MTDRMGTFGNYRGQIPFPPPNAIDGDIQNEARSSNQKRLRGDGGRETVSRRHNPKLQEKLTTTEIGTVLDRIEQGIVLVDQDLQIVAGNDAVLRDTGHTESQLVGQPVDILFDLGSKSEEMSGSPDAPPQIDPPLDITDGSLITIDGDHLSATITIGPRDEMLSKAGFIITYELVNPAGSLRRKQQRQRLAIVNQYNSTLRKVAREVINPTSRGGLESVVCNQLTTTNRYDIAVIGERSPGTGLESMEPRSWSGIDDDKVSQLMSHIAAEDKSNCPIYEAFSTKSVQVEYELQEDSGFQNCLPDGLPVEISSVAVVPIRYGETVYGIIAVYSGQTRPFEDFELRMLEELGGIVGFAYNAVDKNELLVTDTVLELEFEITDLKSFFVSTTREEGGSIELKSAVPRSDGRLLYYLKVTDIPSERIVEQATGSDFVQSVDVVREQGKESWVAFQLTETSLVKKLSVNNMNVRHVISEHGVVTLTLEMSPVMEPKSAVEVISSIYDDFELVRKERRDRPALPIGRVRENVLNRLTNRQRDTLIAAFENGYFERPRKSQAKEVADQLGINTSTYHQHLREALRKLVDETVTQSQEPTNGFNE